LRVSGDKIVKELLEVQVDFGNFRCTFESIYYSKRPMYKKIVEVHMEEVIMQYVQSFEEEAK